MTAEQVELTIQEALENDVNKVVTETPEEELLRHVSRRGGDREGALGQSRGCYGHQVDHPCGI